jgi:hypothetical protein
MNKTWKYISIAIALVAIVALILSIVQPETPMARTYQTAVYTEQGGSKLVVASGGELEVQSGGTIDAQSGSTLGLAAALDMNAAVISNIGNAGTDFASTGGLTLANALAVTTGGATITAGGITVSAGGISVTEGLTVTDGGATVTAGGLTVTAGGATVTAGGLTVTAGGLTISDGDAVIADDVTITKQSAIAVTDGGYITPTGTYQPLTSAGNVGTSNLAIGTAGDLLYLVNTSATTITITDTGTIMLEGNAALGQYDTLHLICDGTNWLQVSKGNN